jgi:hypothetical protein
MLTIAEPRAKPKAERFYRPFRDGRVFFASFPSTSYWATFTESLRDKSSPYNPKPFSWRAWERTTTNLRDPDPFS